MRPFHVITYCVCEVCTYIHILWECVWRVWCGVNRLKTKEKRVTPQFNAKYKTHQSVKANPL